MAFCNPILPIMAASYGLNESTAAGVTLTCSDVYGYAGGGWIGHVEDQFGVEGNISADPLSCDPASGDFSLDADSPLLLR